MFNRPIPLARLGQALLLLAIVLVWWQQTLDPGLNPTYAPISFYARGPHGWVLFAALLATSAGSLLLSRAYGSLYPDRRGGKPLVWLAIAIVLAGALRAQAYFPWERRPTVEGMLHAVASLAGAIFFAYAAFMIAQETRRRLLLAMAIAYVAILLFSGARAGILLLLGLRPQSMGLEERLAFLVAIAWFFVLFPPFGKHKTSLGSASNQA